MNDSNGYAVFFFPQALEALGNAIKPYLLDSPAGAHVLCNEIDTGGAFLQMKLQGVTSDGRALQLELMVPGSMVRMIASSQSDGTFGFGPRLANVVEPALPPVGPTAEPAHAAPDAVPDGGVQPQAPAPGEPAADPGADSAKPAP